MEDLKNMSNMNKESWRWEKEFTNLEECNGNFGGIDCLLKNNNN